MYKQIDLGKIDLLVRFLSSISEFKVPPKPPNFLIAPSKMFHEYHTKTIVQIIEMALLHLHKALNYIVHCGIGLMAPTTTTSYHQAPLG